MGYNIHDVGKSIVNLGETDKSQDPVQTVGKIWAERELEKANQSAAQGLANYMLFLVKVYQGVWLTIKMFNMPRFIFERFTHIYVCMYMGLV